MNLRLITIAIIGIFILTVPFLLQVSAVTDIEINLDNLGLKWESKQGHNAMSIGVSWSPDDMYIANSYWDSAVVIWNAKDGSIFKKLHVPGPSVKDFMDKGWIKSLPPTKGSVTPASSANDLIKPYCDGPEATDNYTYLPTRAISWSPNGKYLAVGSDDTNITLFDTQKWQVLKILSGHKGSVLSLDWSPDSKSLASGSGPDNIDPHNEEAKEFIVKIWNVSSGQAVANLTGHKDSIECVRWSPDGKMLASTSNNVDKIVKIWDIKTKTNVLNITGHDLGVLAVDWSPDGKTLVTGSRDYTIRFWYINNGTQFRNVRSSNCIRSVMYHPNGVFLAVSGPAESMLAVWNLSAGVKKEFTESDTARSTVYQSRWSHDGSKLAASSGKEHKLRLYSFGSEVTGTDKGLLPLWFVGTIIFFAVSFIVSGSILILGAKNFWRKW